MDASVALPSRQEVVQRIQAAGGRIAAVLPVHYPRALLRAHGFHPIELWGPPRVESKEGDRHLQAYACAIVRNATALLLEGGLEAASVILVPHTCDALQGMGSVLRDFAETRARVLTLYPPRVNDASALPYFVDEIGRLGAQLAEIAGRAATEAELLAAVAAEDAADAALVRLYRQRRALPLDDRAFYTLVRAREYLPPAEFAAAAEAVPRCPESPVHGLPVMLSGMVCEPMELFDHIRDLGGTVVADDLACGFRRAYPPVAAADGMPAIERIARTLLGAPPDPTRGATLAERAATLVSRLRDAGARGLIVYGVKYCEPELFELPRLRRYLADAGFPMLHVEHEVAPAVPHQVLTRIEAFLETLQ